jgi:hypothetical protein
VLKRPWSAEEDMAMAQLVKEYGAVKWAVIASYMPGRNGKQCRERCVLGGFAMQRSAALLRANACSLL